MKKGFTLIEVLFAITLLGLAVAPLLGGLTRAMLISVRNERKMRTIFLAQQVVEDLKSQLMVDFSAIDNIDEDEVLLFSQPNEGFKYKICKNPFNDDEAGIKSIKVTVWYDSKVNNAEDPEEEQINLFAKVAKRS